MKITAKALNNAIRALSPLTKSSKAVWIVAGGGTVQVRARAGSASASVTVGACDVPCSVAVPAADLARAVRGSKSDVDVTIQDATVRVTVDGATVTIRTVDGAPPSVPFLDRAGVYVYNGAITKIDDAVRAAVCVDSTRPALCSVRLDAGHAVATDGHRLHAVRVTFQVPDVTIPLPTWDTLAAFARNFDDACMVNVDGATFRADGGGWSVIDTACGATYPAWQQVIPSDVDNEAGIDAGDLAAACKPHVAARKLARTVEATTRVTVNGSVRLVTVAGDANAETSIPCFHVGEERRTAVNVTYLADAAAACAGVTKIAIPANPFSPLMVSDADTRCVIMPMRV